MYDLMFNKYRYRVEPVIFFEVGVQSGGSTYMWEDYFRNINYYGFDINENCKQFERENITIIIGSQSNKTTLLNIIKKNIQIPI